MTTNDTDAEDFRAALAEAPREAIPPLRLALAALGRGDVRLARGIEAHVSLPDETDTGASPSLAALRTIKRVAHPDEAVWWGRLAVLEAERGAERRCRSLDNLLRLRAAS